MSKTSKQYFVEMGHQLHPVTILGISPQWALVKFEAGIMRGVIRWVLWEKIWESGDVTELNGKIAQVIFILWPYMWPFHLRGLENRNRMRPQKEIRKRRGILERSDRYIIYNWEICRKQIYQIPANLPSSKIPKRVAEIASQSALDKCGYLLFRAYYGECGHNGVLIRR